MGPASKITDKQQIKGMITYYIIIIQAKMVLLQKQKKQIDKWPLYAPTPTWVIVRSIIKVEVKEEEVEQE